MFDSAESIFTWSIIFLVIMGVFGTIFGRKGEYGCGCLPFSGIVRLLVAAGFGAYILKWWQERQAKKEEPTEEQLEEAPVEFTKEELHAMLAELEDKS